MVIAASRQNASRTVTILGSTGSIGTQTLALLEAAEESFYIEALVANNNGALLAQQARRVKPGIAVLADEQAVIADDIIAAKGTQAVLEAAARPTDWTMAAIVGIAGLAPAMEALKHTKTLALANKESLVCAGTFFLEEAKKHHTHILPVDSEHSAIFQCLETNNRGAIANVTLTASGGPFRTYSLEQMQNITPKQAVEHPNWEMGAKISIDSATMANKGLELIEAHYLFDIAPEKLDVVIHPESIIHSMVAYEDGATLAQLGIPDMATPIAYALNWPERKPILHPPLSLADYGTLIFEAPDETRFPALQLAKEVLNAGQGAQVIFNAANEVAVQQFIDGEIGFTDIATHIKSCLESIDSLEVLSLDDVYRLDEQVRAPVSTPSRTFSYTA